MLPDSHIHTKFSGDCTTPARAQIERCLALGMEELCITDHHDYDAGQPEESFLLDFDTYLPFLRQLRREYENKIQVHIGVELGLQLHIQDYLEALADSLDLDYIIGSSHFIDRMDPYFPEFFEGRSEQEAYRRFFEVTLKRIEAIDCFDALGHLDYILRYCPATNQNYSYKAYQDYIDPILKTLIQKGKALECNTAGFRYHLGHPNPSGDVLRRYRQLGGELITLGSDGHSPEAVGYGFDMAGALLRDCGFRYITVYHRRKPTFTPL